MRSGLSILCLVTSLTALGGSDNPIGPSICPRPESEEPMPYKGGNTLGTNYEKADWHGRWLYWPGGAFYEIHHNLGQVPAAVDFWLSFDEYGIKNGDSATHAAGNQVELKAVDEWTITVVNGSCSDYYLRVVASIGP